MLYPHLQSEKSVVRGPPEAKAIGLQSRRPFKGAGSLSRKPASEGVCSVAQGFNPGWVRKGWPLILLEILHPSLLRIVEGLIQRLTAIQIGLELLIEHAH